MLRHLTYRSASSAGTTRDIWTDSLLNQICLLRRNPFKLDDPFTNVDSQIQPSAVNLLKAGQPYPLNAARNLTWRLRLTRWQRTRLSRAKEPLKGDSKKTTRGQRPPGRRPGMFTFSKNQQFSELFQKRVCNFFKEGMLMRGMLMREHHHVMSISTCCTQGF